MRAGGRTIGRLLCVTLIAACTGMALGTSIAGAAAVLPPELVAIEQHTNELKLTSLRFTLKESTVVPGGEHEVAKLLKLLGEDSTTTGEETLAPAAANVSLDLFGLRLTVRSVAGVDYAYIGKLARFDHDRPWIRLGRGGLGELFTVNGHPTPIKAGATPQSSVPPLAEPPFSALENELAGAHEVRVLGAGTVSGQPVTSFLAVLEPGQLEGQKRVPLKSPPTPAQLPTTTLEVAFAPSGLPVRMIVRAQDSQLTDTGTLEIPAVNFPLVIDAPAKARTVGIRAYRRLARQSEAAERHSKKKPVVTVLPQSSGSRRSKQ
jgi:hypothetical protein